MTPATNPMKLKLQLALLTLGIACASFNAGAAATITIQADQPGAKINPAMWGVFFEDINFGADGGLYFDLVRVAMLALSRSAAIGRCEPRAGSR